MKSVQGNSPFYLISWSWSPCREQADSSHLAAGTSNAGSQFGALSWSAQCLSCWDNWDARGQGQTRTASTIRDLGFKILAAGTDENPWTESWWPLPSPSLPGAKRDWWAQRGCSYRRRWVKVSSNPSCSDLNAETFFSVDSPYRQATFLKGASLVEWQSPQVLYLWSLWKYFLLVERLRSQISFDE